MGEGQVDRVQDESTVICKNLFNPGTDMNLFLNMKVQLGEAGPVGRIDSTFGKTKSNPNTNPNPNPNTNRNPNPNLSLAPTSTPTPISSLTRQDQVQVRLHRPRARAGGAAGG